MSYLQCGRSGNVDKCQTCNVSEAETSTNVKLKMWSKRKRRQMAYLQCGRNGNVDKCHTYNVVETETSTNVILSDVKETETSINVILTMWSKRKRRQMSYLQCGRNGNVDKCHTFRRERNRNVDKCHTYYVVETETSTNVILSDVNETETSPNVILTIWSKRKRRQMSYLPT